MATAVLAYSGGLDTSCAIAWLKEDYGFDEVVAVLVDVGQDVDFGPAVRRGRAAGADDVLVVDRREAFADNLFGRAIEAGILEDPWAAPPEEAFVLTAAPDEAPEPAEAVIAFEQGLPVAFDEVELPLADLVAALNEQAGAYGIGRIDMIE